jgi:hypothetical protein
MMATEQEVLNELFEKYGDLKESFVRCQEIGDEVAENSGLVWTVKEHLIFALGIFYGLLHWATVLEIKEAESGDT